VRDNGGEKVGEVGEVGDVVEGSGDVVGDSSGSGMDVDKYNGG
jgi:hypothetical protein